MIVEIFYRSYVTVSQLGTRFPDLHPSIRDQKHGLFFGGWNIAAYKHFCYNVCKPKPYFYLTSALHLVRAPTLDIILRRLENESQNENFISTFAYEY